jgi:hypothetical protein
MLAALEESLAGDGIEELHLNVWESNLPAKSLYAAAGYVLAVQFPTMCQLRKRLRAEPAERRGGMVDGAPRRLGTSIPSLPGQMALGAFASRRHTGLGPTAARRR